MKIKSGDKVLIIRGKSRGKTGKVTIALPCEHRIVIEGINLRKKHVRPRQQGQKGQTIEVAAPIDVSNAMLLCDKCTKPTRVGYRVEGKEKYRICKKCSAPLT